ncbi:MAG: hypothetical protein R3C12_10110 [Planctomycetaceae bacterium]|nr:hypothetical protein [Planctomycetaceae bacterium]
MREIGLLVLVLAPCFGIAGLVWDANQGRESLPAFVWAASICLAFGVLALLAQELMFRRQSEFAGSLGSILLRTLGPMLSAVILTAWRPDLVRHQIFPAFVGCYLLTLAAETILSVCLIQRWERRERGRQKPSR